MRALHTGHKFNIHDEKLSSTTGTAIQMHPQASSKMFNHDGDDDNDDDDDIAFRKPLQASSIECIPPPPPEFSECSTPKMNNCKESTKRQRKLLQMLDDKCSPSPDNSPSLPDFKKVDTPKAPVVPSRNRRRPTPTSCPLDDPIQSLEPKIEAYDFDESEPPALPVRRDGLCPSNMPASVLVQMVIGR